MDDAQFVEKWAQKFLDASNEAADKHFTMDPEQANQDQLEAFRKVVAELIDVVTRP